MGSFSFLSSEVLINYDFARNKELTLKIRYDHLSLVLMTIPSENSIL